MTIAQTRAARRRMKNDVRWKKRGRKDPNASAKRAAEQLKRERERAARKSAKK